MVCYTVERDKVLSLESQIRSDKYSCDGDHTHNVSVVLLYDHGMNVFFGGVLFNFTSAEAGQGGVFLGGGRAAPHAEKRMGGATW